MAKTLKYLRTLHSWLGLLVIPWVLMFGLTGFYLNHQDFILGLLPGEKFDESALAAAQLDEPLTLAQAKEIADAYWPDDTAAASALVNYHGFRAYRFDKPKGQVIVSVATGHFYTKTRAVRTTYSPSGEVLDRWYYWKYIFGILHKTGWFDFGFKTLLADITALAFIVFGLSGIVIWGLPRYKRALRLLRLR